LKWGFGPDSVLLLMEGWAMMGERQVRQEALFYGFSLEDHVPSDHLLRAVDRFVDLGSIRRHLEPFYSATGRPSVSSTPPAPSSTASIRAVSGLTESLVIPAPGQR
jgi:hypothetical protein